MRKLVLPSLSDPNRSVDIFDADLQNEFGGMLCIAAALLPDQAEECWREYVKQNAYAE